ncbi:MAG: hypothetical protein JWO31_2098 [Phycisphaerales bacterium]|nr:hypothetical protein [Phycisphaerales bacterium]
MKFGRIKRQHGRVGGLDAILDRIVADCPHVSRIVPGRIRVRRGKTPPSFKVQYPTDAGLKCLYTGTGTVQEVFLICSDAARARAWLVGQRIATAGSTTSAEPSSRSLPLPPEEGGRGDAGINPSSQEGAAPGSGRTPR